MMTRLKAMLKKAVKKVLKLEKEAKDKEKKDA
jgi:hypothetical protein